MIVCVPKISKFYYNVDISEELDSDNGTDDLEEVSEDEYQENV